MMTLLARSPQAITIPVKFIGGAFKPWPIRIYHADLTSRRTGFVRIGATSRCDKNGAAKAKA